MVSRSKNLIELDYKHVLDIKPWGIEVFPIEDGHFYEWTVIIHGLKNTDWEGFYLSCVTVQSVFFECDGGIFRLYIKFTEDYNDHPPKVRFQSIPFHPNIDAVTGQPNLDFFKNPKKWSPSYDTLHILSTIQNRLTIAMLTIVKKIGDSTKNLLSYPKLEDANVVNADAADMCLHHPLDYRQTVHQCVSASQAIYSTELNTEQDLVNTRQPLYSDSTSRLEPPAPHLPSDSFDTSQRSHTSGTARRQCRIPFEDYYRMWSNIATSTNDGQGKYDAKYSNKRVDDTLGFAEQTKSRGTSSDLKQDAATKRKLEQVRRMREMYLKRPPTTPQQPSSSRSQTTELGHLGTSTSSRSQQFDQEVDELVSWTNRLDV